MCVPVVRQLSGTFFTVGLTAARAESGAAVVAHPVSMTVLAAAAINSDFNMLIPGKVSAQFKGFDSLQAAEVATERAVVSGG
jgi:hypothetical protein